MLVLLHLVFAVKLTNTEMTVRQSRIKTALNVYLYLFTVDVMQNKEEKQNTQTNKLKHVNRLNQNALLL